MKKEEMLCYSTNKDTSKKVTMVWTCGEGIKIIWSRKFNAVVLNLNFLNHSKVILAQCEIVIVEV